MSQYTAIGIFHYPDGVMVPGDTAELPDDVAQSGVDAGTIGLTQIAPAPEPTPEPAEPAPVVDTSTETQE